MRNIAFVIFTKNEEKRIGYVVRNLTKYGAVLIFDDASDDRTQEIVEGLGAKFITRPHEIIEAEDERMYQFVRQYVKDGSWIFWGCADYMLPVELLEKMREISLQDKYKYARVPMFTYLWGETKYPAHKGYNPRFFKKDSIDFSGNYLHGFGRFTGTADEILTLPMEEKYAIHHYSLYDMRKYIARHLYCAESEAWYKFEKKKKFSVFLMLGAMCRYFFLFYKRFFRSGVKGFNVAILHAFYRFMVYMRLYELENGLTLESMEKDYSASKERMLKDIV
ncbi:glycosyltransferase [Patescibacteria group bacterium]|nr:MAG: glycosyltransferase [Patescibacteria group bacterium]